MNPQELRNLQEAYMEVVMNEESGDIKDRDEKSSKQKADARMVGAKQLSAHQINLGDISKDEGENRLSKLKKSVNKQLQKRREKVRNRNTTFSRTRGDDALRMGKSPRNQNEELDIYDIILSHLLDEGYASTEETADKIILNMSESWFEEILNERTRYAKETGKNFRTGRTSAEGGDAQIKKRVEKEPWLKYGGSREPKKVPGKKPPRSGEPGSGRQDPAHIVGVRRASVERSKNQRIGSRFD